MVVRERRRTRLPLEFGVSVVASHATTSAPNSKTGTVERVRSTRDRPPSATPGVRAPPEAEGSGSRSQIDCTPPKWCPSSERFGRSGRPRDATRKRGVSHVPETPPFQLENAKFARENRSVEAGRVPWLTTARTPEPTIRRSPSPTTAPTSPSRSIASHPSLLLLVVSRRACYRNGPRRWWGLRPQPRQPTRTPGANDRNSTATAPVTAATAGVERPHAGRILGIRRRKRSSRSGASLPSATRTLFSPPTVS